MNWELAVRVERDGQLAATLPFAHTPIIIGSSPHCDVVLTDPYVSRQHARVIVSRGQMTFYDQSRNGSFIDGQPVKQAVLGVSGHVEIPPFTLWLTLHVTEEIPDTPRDRPTMVADVSGEITAIRGFQVLPPSDDVPRRAESALRSGVHERPVPAPHADPLQSDIPLLRVVGGGEPLLGTTFALDRDVFVIGRGDQATIRIDRGTVSRTHAEVRRQADGRWRVSDLNSVNGIGINGRRVSQHILVHGDRLAIGPEIVLEFSAGRDAHAAGRDPEP